jgi:hypothetical protein
LVIIPEVMSAQRNGQLARDDAAPGFLDHDHRVPERFRERIFERIIRLQGGMNPIGVFARPISF